MSRSLGAACPGSRGPPVADGTLSMTHAIGHIARLLAHTAPLVTAGTDTEHARQIHGVLTDLAGRDRPVFLALGEQGPEGDSNIDSFRSSRRRAVLVSVRKVTEGFDCPDVSVLAHLTTWSARLFINQMVARAMRVTDAERRRGYALVASVMIPDDEEIRRAYLEVLVEYMHVLELPQPKRCDVCALPKVQCVCARPRCPVCRQKTCVCPCADCGQRPCACDLTSVTVIDEAAVTAIAHDGTEVALDLVAEWEALLRADGMPPLLAPTVAATITKRMTNAAGVPGGRQPPATRPATPREEADAIRARLDRAAGWWHRFGDTPVADFQVRVNKAGGLGPGDRPWASPEELRPCWAHALDLVRSRCERAGLACPAWAVAA